MPETAGDARERVRGLLDAGEFERSLLTARQELSSSPDDVELLVLAGRAGIELDDETAVDHLRRASELAPDDAAPWHHLGEALAAEGRMDEAEAAFRRAVELDPDDQLALTHLGHTAVAAGRKEEGVGYLARASDIAHAPSSAAISLVDMYRSFGQYDEALAQARRITEAVPDDVLAWLDLAELSLQVGQLDAAATAFEHVREVDDVPGHEAYPLHGLLLVEIHREAWQRAKELDTHLAAIDQRGLSADVGNFVRHQAGEEGEEPPPERAQVEGALAASLADYRRMLYDDRGMDAGEPGG
jgi:Flp pilus assembly protein TadD